MPYTTTTHATTYTCDVENVQRRPMGGIDGCILLLNELLTTCIHIPGLECSVPYECTNASTVLQLDCRVFCTIDN